MLRRFKLTSKTIPLAIGIIVLILAISYLAFINYFQGKIYPGIKIGVIPVGGSTPSVTQKILEENFQNRVGQPLDFAFDDQKFSLEFASSKPQLDIQTQVNEVYRLGRSGNFTRDLQIQLQALILGITKTPKVTYQHPALLTYQISNINQLIKLDPENAKVLLGENIIITPSRAGEELDSKLLIDQIDSFLSLKEPKPSSLPVKITSPKFTTETAKAYQTVLENMKNSPLKIHYKKNVLILDQLALFNLLDFSGNNQNLDQTSLGSQNLPIAQIVLDKDKLLTKLIANFGDINQDAKDARFVFDQNSKRVREFQSAQEGKKIDVDKLSQTIAQAAALGNAQDLELPVVVTKPKITTSEINNFGINELLGEGISHFAGSIDNRIYNIGLASSRLNGILVAPGQTFSFNQTVGDISASTGYKPAYVIKSGRTVLDDGGGVCQVSTTLFRAILNAGLPIVERTAHAYRVGYYEQGFPPGLDATVFAPSVDLKFKNDTPQYILIQASVSGTSLYVDIYGTSDGRVSALSTPKILNQTPPPPELRQDDPTLPRGEVKQVDWSAWGANVSFTRTVTKGGEKIISETWRSNYRPWQAVYLVGTK